MVSGLASGRSANGEPASAVGAVMPATVAENGTQCHGVVDIATVKPSPFEYHRPTTTHDAVRLLSDLGDGAKVLAGGQSLVPMLSLRLAVFDHLIDITRIAQLRGIDRRNGSVWVGAGTTQRAVGASQLIVAGVPLLAKATPLIGHFQIRNRGTIGGSLAHADAAAEYPAVALALDASFEVLGPGGARTVAASEFFAGFWDTAMSDDELLTGILFPVWSGRCGFAVNEVARRHGDFAMAGAVVAVELDTNDRVRRCAIAMFGMGPAARRAHAAESELVGSQVDSIDLEEIGRSAVRELDAVVGDAHVPEEYRRRIGAVVVERALREAVREAGDG